MSKGLSLIKNLQTLYEPCILNKTHRMPNQKPSYKYAAIKPGEVWHIDLYKGGKTLSLKGYRYFLTLTDIKSRYRHIILLKNKSDTLSALETFLK